MMSSCQLVRSKIDHTRHGTPSHFLSRRGLSIWIDLDRLDEAAAQSALSSVDGFNLLSFGRRITGPISGQTGRWCRLPAMRATSQQSCAPA